MEYMHKMNKNLNYHSLLHTLGFKYAVRSINRGVSTCCVFTRCVNCIPTSWIMIHSTHHVFPPLFFTKLHPKIKNYHSHTFYIISWNLIEIQLWDFKYVVANTRANTMQILSFLALVLFEKLKKRGVLRKSTPADATIISGVYIQ